MAGSFPEQPKPNTVEEAAALLRLLADQLTEWADRQALNTGVETVTWAIVKAGDLRGAASVIENGFSGSWFSYAPHHPEQPGD